MFQGGECLSLGHLLRTWPPAISVKTTLRFSHRSETSVCTYSVPSPISPHYNTSCKLVICASLFFYKETPGYEAEISQIMRTIFHFMLLCDSEFETLGSTTRLLSQLRFNPFQTNQNIALSGSNIDLIPISTQIIYVVIISYQRILKRGLKPKIYKENFR